MRRGETDFALFFGRSAQANPTPSKNNAFAQDQDAQIELKSSGLQTALRTRGRGRTIYDLVHGVDRFPFTGTTTDNEDLGHEMEVHIARIVWHVILGVLAKNNARNAHRLPAVAAKDSSKLGGFGNSSHQKGSLGWGLFIGFGRGTGDTIPEYQ
jgi:hypothetical protein